MDTPDVALEPAAAPDQGAGPSSSSRIAVALAPAVAVLDRFAVPLILLVAAVLRFSRLGEPNEIIPLDETYYARDARQYLQVGAETSFAVHPPVGKWMIAAGMKVAGDDPFGWRFSAAIIGTLSILLVYLIAQRLWASRFASLTAMVLIAVDGLFFVQSRIAMLDIFLAFFILLAFWMLLEDRARAGILHTGIRWWRIGAGLSIGLALATKWAAGPLIPVLFAVAAVWEWRRWHAQKHGMTSWHRMNRCATCGRTTEGDERACAQCGADVIVPEDLTESQVGELRRRALRQTTALLLTFGLLPVLMYVGSYGPWFASTKRYVPPRCNEAVTVAGVNRTQPKAGMELWLCNQKEIFEYHKNLKSQKDDGSPVHPYMSRGQSWPWIGRPAAHYFAPSTLDGTTQGAGIFGIPNPLVWWPAFLVAIPILLVMAVRRDAVAALILALFAPLYLPWLVASRPLFLFYMTPAVPFLVLALTHVLHRLTTRFPGVKPAVVTYTVLAVGAFAYFYPVLAAVPIPDAGTFGWRARMWLQRDCLTPGVKRFCWI